MLKPNATDASEAWLDQLRLAWSPSRLSAFLAERLPNAGSIAGVAIRGMKYRRGLCTMQYSVELDGGAPAPLVATLGKAKKMRPILEVAAPGSMPDDPLAPGATYLLPDRDWLIEVFPADHRVPGIDHAMSAAEVERLLADGGGTSPAVADVSVIRHRPHQRCVLAYLFADGSGAIGKVYGESRQARTAWEALVGLYGQAADRGLALPRPLAMSEERPFVIMERVEGESLQDILLRSETSAEAEEAVAAAASALATLHSLAFLPKRTREVRSYDNRLRRAEVPLRLLASELEEPLAGLAGPVRRTSAMLAADAARRPTALIHGDLQGAHVLLEAGRAAIVDLEDACPGDPALDVGHLMASLDAFAVEGRKAHLDRLPTYLLEEYERLSGRSVGERATAYRGMNLAKSMLNAVIAEPDLDVAMDFRDHALLIDRARSILSELD